MDTASILFCIAIVAMFICAWKLVVRELNDLEMQDEKILQLLKQQEEALTGIKENKESKETTEGTNVERGISAIMAYDQIEAHKKAARERNLGK